MLNPAAISTYEWDVALSSGKKVSVVGNDDTHNVLNKNTLGRMCTFVNVAQNDRKEVLKSLKSGQGYGVVVGESQDMDSIPFLNRLTVDGRTMTVFMSQPADEVEIKGQNGKLLAIFMNTEKVSYRLNKSDHYARATFKYKNGTTIYLNPVFFTPASGYREPVVSENRSETILFSFLGDGIYIIWFSWVLRLLTMRRTPFVERTLAGVH